MGLVNLGWRGFRGRFWFLLRFFAFWGLAGVVLVALDDVVFVKRLFDWVLHEAHPGSLVLDAVGDCRLLATLHGWGLGRRKGVAVHVFVRNGVQLPVGCESLTAALVVELAEGVLTAESLEYVTALAVGSLLIEADSFDFLTASVRFLLNLALEDLKLVDAALAAVRSMRLVWLDWLLHFKCELNSQNAVYSAASLNVGYRLSITLNHKCSSTLVSKLKCS